MKVAPLCVCVIKTSAYLLWLTSHKTLTYEVNQKQVALQYIQKYKWKTNDFDRYSTDCQFAADC